MSSIGTGYDLEASTFSPDGRIFQIEYAQKAVDNCGTVVVLAGKDGVLTAVDRIVPSVLLVEDANPRTAHVNDFIGFTGAGVYPDCQALLDYVQEEAAKYLKDYREPVPIAKLAQGLAEYIHIFTLGISRPFGCSIFLTSYSKEEGPIIYMIEPSGLYFKYKAWSVGKHGQAAKTEIEKLKLEDLSMVQLLKEAVKILFTVRDESKQKNQKIEVGWVSAETNGLHKLVPQNIVNEAETWAKNQLEEDDIED